MMKKDELADPTSCLNKAGPRELLFILRAKDPHAAQTIRLWAAMSDAAHDFATLKEALSIADQMDQWHCENTSAPIPAGGP